MGKQVSVGVISGLIVAVLYSSLLRPLANAVWGLLNLVFGSLIAAEYVNAARGIDGMAATLVFVMGLSLMTGLAVFTGIALIMRMRPKEERPERQSRSRRATTARLVTIAVWLVFATADGVAVVTDYELNTGFHQRLAALAPYIPTNDEESLRAMWANMRTRQDHLDIIAKMDAMASAAGTSIPKPLVK